jgi:Costars
MRYDKCKLKLSRNNNPGYRDSYSKASISCFCVCIYAYSFHWFYLFQKRLEEEIKQLLLDIKRIGIPGTPSVTFGELFDDDDVQQYYEALVGTLKCAKKRGLIEYKGMLLLKGVSDDVIISICG